MLALEAVPKPWQDERVCLHEPLNSSSAVCYNGPGLPVLSPGKQRAWATYRGAPVISTQSCSVSKVQPKLGTGEGIQ